MCMNSETTNRDTLDIDDILSDIHRTSSNKDSGIIRTNNTIEL